MNGQHPDLAEVGSSEIDHPDTAALSAACGSPPDFPNTTGFGYNGSCLGVLGQFRLKRGVLIVIEIVVEQPREQRRFDKGQH